MGKERENSLQRPQLFFLFCQKYTYEQTFEISLLKCVLRESYSELFSLLQKSGLSFFQTTSLRILRLLMMWKLYKFSKYVCVFFRLLRLIFFSSPFQCTPTGMPAHMQSRSMLRPLELSIPNQTSYSESEILKKELEAMRTFCESAKQDRLKLQNELAHSLTVEAKESYVFEDT